mgnify:CR=1 FL=1
MVSRICARYQIDTKFEEQTMSENKARISIEVVDGLSCTKGQREAKLWDSKLTGFFVRAYPTGRKVYAVKYRFGRTQRIVTIGAHGAFTPDAAREAATKILSHANLGTDTALARHAQKTAPTVKDLADNYFTSGRMTQTKKRESTWTGDERRVAVHILPQIGKLPINEVNSLTAAKTIFAIAKGKTAKTQKGQKPRGVSNVTGGAVAASRTKATVSAMFNWGIEHMGLKTNPFAKIKTETAKTKERFLSNGEANSLIDAINTLEAEKRLSSAFADAFRILLLTGARKSEITNLQWHEVDFENKLLRLAPERNKTGNKTGEAKIMLMPAALSILSRRHEEHKTAKKIDQKSSNYVFKSNRTNSGIVGLHKSFKDVLARADIGALRIHDLRHSFASFAIADGANLYLVSKLLGHANSRTTERYAHLSNDPLHAAVTQIGKRFEAINVDNESGGEVIKPRAFE